MISVIVPAHNEQNVIERTLHALIQDAEPGEIEIIVACNGCVDSTAAIARGVAGPIQVVEIETASKAKALNIGDKLASGFPRFYVDADLVFTLAELRKVAVELKNGNKLAAAPEFVFDLTKSSRAVHAYYRVWHKMPYFDTGRIAGAYGLSQEGRKRFNYFPDVTSDDGFVRLQFAPHERITVSNSKVIVTAPRTLRSLIHVKIRSHAGTAELRKKYSELFLNETASPIKSIKRLVTHGLPLYDILVYVIVSSIAKTRGAVNSVMGIKIWARDESSRGRNEA